MSMSQKQLEDLRAGTHIGGKSMHHADRVQKAQALRVQHQMAKSAQDAKRPKTFVGALFDKPLEDPTIASLKQRLEQERLEKGRQLVARSADRIRFLRKAPVETEKKVKLMLSLAKDLSSAMDSTVEGTDGGDFSYCRDVEVRKHVERAGIDSGLTSNLSYINETLTDESAKVAAINAVMKRKDFGTEDALGGNETMCMQTPPPSPRKKSLWAEAIPLETAMENMRKACTSQDSQSSDGEEETKESMFGSFDQRSVAFLESEFGDSSLTPRKQQGVLSPQNKFVFKSSRKSIVDGGNIQSPQFLEREERRRKAVEDQIQREFTKDGLRKQAQALNELLHTAEKRHFENRKKNDMLTEKLDKLRFDLKIIRDERAKGLLDDTRPLMKSLELLEHERDGLYTKMHHFEQRTIFLESFFEQVNRKQFVGDVRDNAMLVQQNHIKKLEEDNFSACSDLKKALAKIYKTKKVRAHYLRQIRLCEQQTMVAYDNLADLQQQYAFLDQDHKKALIIIEKNHPNPVQDARNIQLAIQDRLLVAPKWPNALKGFFDRSIKNKAMSMAEVLAGTPAKISPEFRQALSSMVEFVLKEVPVAHSDVAIPLLQNLSPYMDTKLAQHLSKETLGTDPVGQALHNLLNPVPELPSALVRKACEDYRKHWIKLLGGLTVGVRDLCNAVTNLHRENESLRQEKETHEEAQRAQKDDRAFVESQMEQMKDVVALIPAMKEEKIQLHKENFALKGQLAEKDESIARIEKTLEDLQSMYDGLVSSLLSEAQTVVSTNSPSAVQTQPVESSETPQSPRTVKSVRFKAAMEALFMLQALKNHKEPSTTTGSTVRKRNVYVMTMPTIDSSLREVEEGGVYRSPESTPRSISPRAISPKKSPKNSSKKPPISPRSLWIQKQTELQKVKELSLELDTEVPPILLPSQPFHSQHMSRPSTPSFSPRLNKNSQVLGQDVSTTSSDHRQENNEGAVSSLFLPRPLETLAPCTSTLLDHDNIPPLNVQAPIAQKHRPSTPKTVTPPRSPRRVNDVVPTSVPQKSVSRPKIHAIPSTSTVTSVSVAVSCSPPHVNAGSQTARGGSLSRPETAQTLFSDAPLDDTNSDEVTSLGRPPTASPVGSANSRKFSRRVNFNNKRVQALVPNVEKETPGKDLNRALSANPERVSGQTMSQMRSQYEIQVKTLKNVMVSMQQQLSDSASHNAVLRKERSYLEEKIVLEGRRADRAVSSANHEAQFLRDRERALHVAKIQQMETQFSSNLDHIREQNSAAQLSLKKRADAVLHKKNLELQRALSAKRSMENSPSSHLRRPSSVPPNKMAELLPPSRPPLDSLPGYQEHEETAEEVRKEQTHLRQLEESFVEERRLMVDELSRLRRKNAVLEYALSDDRERIENEERVEKLEHLLDIRHNAHMKAKAESLMKIKGLELQVQELLAKLQEERDKRQEVTETEGMIPQAELRRYAPEPEDFPEWHAGSEREVVTHGKEARPTSAPRTHTNPVAGTPTNIFSTFFVETDTFTSTLSPPAQMIGMRSQQQLRHPQPHTVQVQTSTTGCQVEIITADEFLSPAVLLNLVTSSVSLHQPLYDLLRVVYTAQHLSASLPHLPKPPMVFSATVKCVTEVVALQNHHKEWIGLMRQSLAPKPLPKNLSIVLPPGGKEDTIQRPSSTSHCPPVSLDGKGYHEKPPVFYLKRERELGQIARGAAVQARDQHLKMEGDRSAARLDALKMRARALGLSQRPHSSLK